MATHEPSSSLHTSYNRHLDYASSSAAPSASPPQSPPTTTSPAEPSTQYNGAAQPLVGTSAPAPYNAAHKPFYKRPIPWLIALLSAIAIAAIALAAYYGVQYHNQVQANNSLISQSKSSNCLPTGECMIWSDEFTASALDTSKWQYEYTMSGEGNGEFEMYTNSSNNTFIDSSNILHIAPTFTSDWLNPATDCTNGAGNFTQGCQVNMYKLYGICTNPSSYGCVRTSAGLDGYDVMTPIRSSRINTLNSFAFTYGRMEVRAKLPVGDWLWPAIWLMPVSYKYGPWPASGEIDVMESRGNAAGYTLGGNNAFTSTLHWGGNTQITNGATDVNDLYTMTQKSFSSAQTSNTTLTSDFHIYGLKWTADELYTYIDNDANRVFSIDFSQESMYARGQQQLQAMGLSNLWATGGNSAPFDSDFHIIIDLAVGGTNGYFQDGSDKPWKNFGADAAPMTHFWNNRTQGANWGQTWNMADSSTHLQVDYVRVYQ